jgi:hypothetical protein
MHIVELFLVEAEENADDQEPIENGSTPDGYSTDADDQSILTLSDLRKTRLTLSQLNKLRQMNDVKKIEHEQKLKSLSSMYKPAEQDAGGMGM